MGKLYLYNQSEQLVNNEDIASIVLFQPVFDDELEHLGNEIAMIREMAPGIDFTFAAFKVDSWNDDLSPWAAPPVFGDEGFGGCAARTLEHILALLPEEFPETDEVFIGGYSLAGLFALWAAYQTDVFSGAAAVSPSVWFPGWTDYGEAHSVRTCSVYLSLGNKEEKTRNPVMRTVGYNIRRQHDLLRSDPGCGNHILEMNEGNHFREPDLRTAKGFAWLLNNRKVR